MKLYHGSTIDIREIDLLKSKPNKDFGKGFYLSADKEQAYEMAVDALGLCITDRMNSKEVLPSPSSPENLTVDDGFLMVIEFDLLSYKKRTNSKAVKKTLTIPEWLNEEATALGVNFSQVLQEALIAKIEAKV